MSDCSQLNPIILRSLVCKRDMQMALICFHSLHVALGNKINLIIHEDGSLEDKDANTLAERFPLATIIRRRDTEEIVMESLSQYPSCRKYRQTHPLSNKLLDIPLLSDKSVQFIDCDILFFQKVRSLFGDYQGNIFMFEDDDGHCAPLLNLIVKHDFRIAKGFNSGLFRFDLSGYDLDWIDWMLGRPDLMRVPGLAEQTCYAALSGRRQLRQFSPRQFFCSRFTPITITPETIAVHFIYHLKQRVSHYYESAIQCLNKSDPVELRIRKSRRLTVLDVVGRRICRPFRKLSS
jgi:hypothetical protein